MTGARLESWLMTRDLTWQNQNGLKLNFDSNPDLWSHSFDLKSMHKVWKKKKKLNAILWSPVDFSHKACCVSHKYDERISLLIKHFKSRVVCIHLYLCLLYLLFCGPRFIAATCRSVVYCGTISCSVYNVNHIHGTKNVMKFVGL